jgi:DNA-binding GntR family transcriptional regulator
MPSERVQRRIDALLDESDEAISRRDWQTAREKDIEFQDKALAITQERGMQPLIERILERREILRA